MKSAAARAARKKVARALAEHPTISARALAVELGLSHSFVQHERRKLGLLSAGKRVLGRDQKSYAAEVRPRPPTLVQQLYAVMGERAMTVTEVLAALDAAGGCVVTSNDPYMLISIALRRGAQRDERGVTVCDAAGQPVPCFVCVGEGRYRAASLNGSSG